MGKTQTPNYNLTKDDQNEFYDILMHAQNMDLIDGALKGLSDNKVSKVEGKDLSTNDFTTLEKEKLAGIQEGATNYQHPATHSLDMITETTLRKIFSSAERSKLNGIEEGANNYTHPSSHSLDMITETTAKKIMTSAERSKLAGIQSGAQVNTVTSVAGKTGAVSVTKSDVGLGSVLNYGVATTAEAQAGTSSTKYMTPLRVKEAVDANVKIAHGTYTGDGTIGRNIVVGFQPKKIIIGNEYQIVIITEVTWVRISNGSSDERENILTSTGFTISSDAVNYMNGANKIYEWTAIG
ncbi:hypothetical protein QBE53_06155 [Vallitaleaceae bacterium 9-2]